MSLILATVYIRSKGDLIWQAKFGLLPALHAASVAFWAEAALGRGDLVTATASKLADVKDLSERFGDRVLHALS